MDALLSRAPVLPVLAIDRIDDAVPLARTLVEAGLPVPEMTLRTPAALDAVARIVADVTGAVVGAGTVPDCGASAAGHAGQVRDVDRDHAVALALHADVAADGSRRV